MKKLVYLLSIVLVATLFSCEEENVEPDISNDFNTELLVGEWNGDSLVYEGTTYTDTNGGDLFRDHDKTLAHLDINFVTSSTWVLGLYHEDGYYINSEVYDFEIDGNIISTYLVNSEFEILSTETEVQNGALRLKLLETSRLDFPVGGIYHFSR